MSQPSTRPERAPLPPRLHVRHDDGADVLVVPEGHPFEALRDWLRATVPDALPRLGGAAVRLDLGERELELFELRRIVHLLKDDFRLDVVGLHVTPGAIHRYAERELRLRLYADLGGAAERHAARVGARPIGLPGLAEAIAALDDLVDLDDADLEPVEPVDRTRSR